MFKFQGALALASGQSYRKYEECLARKTFPVTTSFLSTTRAKDAQNKSIQYAICKSPQVFSKLHSANLCDLLFQIA